MSVAFLNGQIGFHDSGHEKYFKKLNSTVNVKLIDNLFVQPNKLKDIVTFDTLVVGSTGFEYEKLEKLFELFERMNYIPQSVVFAPNEDPFLSVARQLQGKTKFYRLEYATLELEELEYLNK